MRIGIDARPLSWPSEGGIPRVCSNLVKELSHQTGCHQIVVFSDDHVPEERRRGFEVEVLSGPMARYVAWDLPAALARHGCDALLSLSPGICRRTIPTVQLIHDVYPLFYCQLLPRHFMFTRPYWRNLLAAKLQISMMRWTDGVLAVSEQTASDIRAHSTGVGTPIRVARPGVDSGLVGTITLKEATDHVNQRFGLDSPFFLYAGAINYQKNVETVLRAFSLFRDQTDSKVELVLVGQRNWPTAKLDNLQSEKGVTHLPWVSSYDLRALYTASAAFVCLSLYEGFGLPVLEAMSCGTPVIVSQCGSLTEIVGDAGIVVEAMDVLSVVKAMGELISNPDEHARRSELSRQRATAFSWEDMAHTAFGLIEEVARLQ